MRTEEERRKPPSLLGLSPAANKHAKGPFSSEGRAGGGGWGAGAGGRGGAPRGRPRQPLLFVEHLLCAGPRGCWAAGPPINSLRTSGATPAERGLQDTDGDGRGEDLRAVGGDPVSLIGLLNTLTPRGAPQEAAGRRQSVQDKGWPGNRLWACAGWGSLPGCGEDLAFLGCCAGNPHLSTEGRSPHVSLGQPGPRQLGR